MSMKARTLKMMTLLVYHGKNPNRTQKMINLNFKIVLKVDENILFVEY